MTCIAAIVEDGTVYMMGDSLITGEDGEAESRNIQKVFEVNGFLIGYDGYAKTGQVVKNTLDVPAKKRNQSISKYMETTFITALEECLAEGNVIKFKSGDTSIAGHFLVGYAGSLYCVGTDLEISKSITKYDAIGSAAGVAKGSLFTTDDFELYPQERLKLALHAAEKFSNVVRRPFIYKEM